MCISWLPNFLGMKECNFHRSTFCVHQAFGHVIWCFHQGKIYIFVGWCGFSSCPHQDSQWFLFHQGPEMVETHWKWFYTLWHTPKVHNNLFNSEKFLNHSEKKLPEIIHVKLQTILPLRVFEFFPYSRGWSFSVLCLSGLATVVLSTVRCRVGYGCQMLYVVLEDVPTLEHYPTLQKSDSSVGSA